MRSEEYKELGTEKLDRERRKPWTEEGVHIHPPSMAPIFPVEQMN